MTKKNSKARRANLGEATAAPVAFTREWVSRNPEAFRRLAAPPAECPVCMEPLGKGREPLGPITGDTPTCCRQFLRRACWLNIVDKCTDPSVHCPLCREDVTDWLHGELDEYLGAFQEATEIKETFKEYIGKSIKMSFQMGDLEMANTGCGIFKTIWPTDDWGSIRYESPLWRMLGRPGPS